MADTQDPDDILRDQGEDALRRKIDEAHAKSEAEKLKLPPLYEAINQPYEAPLTEGDVASHFIDLLEDRLRFDHSRGAWFIWNGTAWREDFHKLVLHTLALLSILVSRNYQNKQTTIRTNKFIKGVDAICRTDRRISVIADQWDNNPDLLGTPTGTIDLKTGLLRASRPDEMISRQTLVAPSPGPCSQWLEFLHEATGDDLEMIQWLQRWFGYCLSGHTREEQLAFVFGPGGNGKGVCIGTVARLMNDYHVTAPMALFIASEYERHSTDAAMLAGSRMVTANETSAGKQWDEEKLKLLTGSDPITARFLYRNNFTFQPQFTLTISGNHAPSLENVDAAIQRRLNIVPFTKQPKEVDSKLKSRLIEEEGPQILHWIIQGARDWYNEGLIRPKAMDRATNSYFSDQDTLQTWINEECTVDPLAETPLEKLYAAFSAFSRNEKRAFMSKTKFSQTLVNDHGFARRKSMYGAMISGLKLDNPDLT